MEGRLIVRKMIFGALLFAAGTLGVIGMTMAAFISPIHFSNLSQALEWMEVRTLFIIFCLMGLAGVVLCAVEAFRKEKP